MGGAPTGAAPNTYRYAQVYYSFCMVLPFDLIGWRGK